MTIRPPRLLTAHKGTRFLVLLCVLLVATTAWADREAAKAAFNEGSSLYALGRFDAAAAAYERAYEEAPIPALLFNIAQAHLEAGNEERALVFYRSFLREAPDSPNRPVAQERMKIAEQAVAKKLAEKEALAAADAERQRLEFEAKRAQTEATRIADERKALEAAARDREAEARIAEASAKAAEEEPLTSQPAFWSVAIFAGVAALTVAVTVIAGGVVGVGYIAGTTADTLPETDLR